MARRDLPHMQDTAAAHRMSRRASAPRATAGGASRFGHLWSRVIGSPAHGVLSLAGSGPPPTFSASGRAASA